MTNLMIIQVEVSTTGRSLEQRSPTKCVFVFVCVTECYKAQQQECTPSSVGGSQAYEQRKVLVL